jgi:hypothetical protein
LKIDPKIYGKDESIILVASFDNEIEAAEYIRAFRSTKKHLLEIKEAQIMMITKDNLREVLTKNKKKEYEAFYEEYY